MNIEFDATDRFYTVSFDDSGFKFQFTQEELEAIHDVKPVDELYWLMIHENQRVPDFKELEEFRQTYENYKNTMLRD